MYAGVISDVFIREFSTKSPDREKRSAEYYTGRNKQLHRLNFNSILLQYKVTLFTLTGNQPGTFRMFCGGTH
jgi:hypothetical protein